MNKTAEIFLDFVEGVNDEYYEKTDDTEVIPTSLTTCGDYSFIKLDIECILCSTEDENLEEGIESIDRYIKKVKSLKRALVNQYRKLSDERLEYFGVYQDEGE